jgi:methylmalonyl-CoA mutase
MDDLSDDLKLATAFPSATEERWRGLVEAVLKGADFEKKLVSRTADGIAIRPLYPKADGVSPVGRAVTGPWRMAQRLDHPDPAEANALVLADLEGGADALVLAFAGAPAARGFGVEANDVAALERALAGVMLDLVALHVETAPFQGRGAAAGLASLAARRGHDLSALDVEFGLDPIGDAARTGVMPLAWPDLSARAANTARSLAERGFKGPFLRVDTRPVHEAGGSEAQELTFALATGIAYLRALEAGGFPLDAARSAVSFLLVADADEILTVAKFRALRRLWVRVEEACGLSPKPTRLRAETAWRMITRRDPWVNILRATVAAFSAGIGGADGITTLPFTAALGLPDAFARRIARNTQIVLLEEANLWRVADPAAGAGGFEAMTDALCERAWAQFQALERDGGIAAALASGAFQRQVAAVRVESERAVARRKDAITGTSEFPDIREAKVSVLTPERKATPASGRATPAPSAQFDDIIAQIGAGAALFAPPPSAPATTFDPLPSRRLAEPYEVLRDRSDARLAEAGRRPIVFLANLGPVAAFTARASFAKNLFEAGGIEAVTNEGFAGTDDLVTAYMASGARIACLCSSDEVYAAQAEPAAVALREAGAAAIYLAGRPGENGERLAEAGVSGYVYAGCDVLAALHEAFDKA